MTDQIAIHTEGLTKHYGDVEALVDLDLDVRAGRDLRFPRSQRRRQDDDDPHDPRRDPADLGTAPRSSAWTPT